MQLEVEEIDGIDPGFSESIGLFERQLEVFHNIIDETDCCGRRSGKTVVLSRKAIAAAKRYKREGLGQSLIAICYPTLDRAVRIMWPMLVQKAFAYGWKVDQTHHIIRAPEGSEIWLIGLDDAYDINKLRGNPYHVIMIDECQDLRPNFHQLIDIVIRPALEDYNGKLTLSGTCDPSCHGYWYEACHDQNFAHFNWSMFDNPMLPAWAGKSDWRDYAAAARRRILERNHWDESNPTFRNEYLGLWTRDESKLVYNRYQPEYNDYLPDPKRNLPDGNDWRFIVSLDFGFTDAFATSALAFSYSNKAVYEVNAEAFRGTTLMDWGAVIDRYRRTYDPIVSMVGDEGGLGKAIVVELNKRYGFNIKPAEKSSKNTFIQLVNSLFDKRLLFVRRESPLKDQLLSLTWDRNKDGKEDPKQSNDLTDAFLYGVRESRHYLAIEPDIIPDIGTDEYNKYINDKTKKEFLEYYDKERKGKLRPYL